MSALPLSLAVRLAHLTDLARKPKPATVKVAKATPPAPLKRSARAQAPAPQPGSRFAHLNAGLTPTAAMPSKRAAELPPTPQAMAAQILSAGKPRPPAPPRTEVEKIAAGVLATARKLQPGRF